MKERTLLTGHSHQAWPDCAFDGQIKAWTDAAELVDTKWDAAFAKADRIREGFASLLGDHSGLYSLAPNTHDLLVRFLSALDLRKKPRIVTTDSEFFSLRRQLQRLQEEGGEVVWVAAYPVHTLPERMIKAIDGRTAAVMMSSVFFNSGQIAPDLAQIQERCTRVGASFLLDVYHSLNVVPFEIAGLESAFIVGGGYKYCQLGEGNCFLRFPRDCELRPVVTGWMADFEALEKSAAAGKTGYGPGGARFEGSTYDPTSHYRGAEVFDFFRREKLSPAVLRKISQTQMRLLCDEFDALNLNVQDISRDRSIPVEGIAGFLALKTPRAAQISSDLMARGIWTDFRGEVLRLGPAPYVSDQQIKDAVRGLGEVALRFLGRNSKE